jgi:DNA-binding protein H-NS
MNPLTIPDDALKRFRDAATKFTRDASPRASRLLAVKDDIATLRNKGASFRTIGELLTQNGIAASDTCVMRFCQRELGEKSTRSAKRKSVAAPKSTPAANGHAASPAPLTKAAQAVLLDNLLSAVPANLSVKPASESGPRIARIEFAKPGEL